MRTDLKASDIARYKRIVEMRNAGETFTQIAVAIGTTEGYARVLGKRADDVLDDLSSPGTARCDLNRATQEFLVRLFGGAAYDWAPDEARPHLDRIRVGIRDMRGVGARTLRQLEAWMGVPSLPRARKGPPITVRIVRCGPQRHYAGAASQTCLCGQRCRSGDKWTACPPRIIS